MNHELVLFSSGDLTLTVPVTPDRETVWLTQDQMSVLFDTARSSIAYHIGKIFKEKELDKNTSVEIFDRSSGNASRPPMYYNLDVIISVGYRVKSQRGVEFRKWANSVLKQFILKGYAVNETRLKELGSAVRLMQRVRNDLDAEQVLNVVERYSTALDLLDDYDHQTLKRPAGQDATYVLTYEECRDVIDRMRFGNESELFGKEKDDSFKGSIGNIYQSFGGKDLYPTIGEKAANLLYYVTKNHSFIDGNKRIAATLFLYFLDRNGKLYDQNGDKKIEDHTLVALTIMIAESRPDEKEIMVSVIMNCI
ncbi:MAG: virulence RhuM family protein [Clostridia bacterium]|nr:virulence RhuM family protein [Clostridia bacterium]